MNQTTQSSIHIPNPKLEAFDQMLRRATEKEASDIHLKSGLPPILRIHGDLYYLKDENGNEYPRYFAENLETLVHALLNKRQLEHYLQGNELDLGYELAAIGRFRISLGRGRSSARLVIRHIPEKIKTFNELGLPNVVQDLVHAERGLILITGSTGSGKSTTLAALIDSMSRLRSGHVVTIEDPIEFSFKDRKSIITQREVGTDTPSFAHALKHSLRQDPNIILVGEMRDEETILLALSAAETGHLVLSTLHTTDAIEAIHRIVGAVRDSAQSLVRTQLAAVLVAVIAQRLVRDATGKKRIPAVEVLLNNARVRDLILDPKRVCELRSVMEESEHIGMTSFDKSLMTLVKSDRITEQEAFRYCSNAGDFQLRLSGVLDGSIQTKSKAAFTTHDQSDSSKQVVSLQRKKA